MNSYPDRSYLSASQDLILELVGGGEHETRGRVARLKQTAAQVKGSFSRSGWQAWIPAPAREERIAAVRLANGERRRVVHAELLGGAYSPSRRSTLRLELQEITL